MEQATLPALKTSVRLYKGENSGTHELLAFADLTIGGAFVIKGIKIMMGKSTEDKPAGVFIGFPSRKGKAEGQYVDVAHPITSEAYHAARECVLAAYQKAAAGEGVAA